MSEESKKDSFGAEGKMAKSIQEIRQKGTEWEV
jgi:hypothetical protein